MKRQRQDGFTLSNREVRNDILIPRYYDPRIAADLDELNADFELISLRELVHNGMLIHSHGDYIPKLFYGTGPFPYVRTSDFANWEIKASPKHGVPKAVFDEYAPEQHVSPHDILFVHEGTYLIGAVAMVTEFDPRILYQHHVAKFTVLPSAPFNAFYLLVALESPLVHRQIRSKQFSADIIDSVVGRLEEVVIPFSKDQSKLDHVQRCAEEAVVGRAKLREQIRHAVEAIDRWLRGDDGRQLDEILLWEPTSSEDRQTAFLGGRRGFSATSLRNRDIINDVLLPRYYDPWVSETAEHYRGRCGIRSIGELIHAGLIAIDTGDEIGRLNYGTGDIPFVRTSDFGSWELKRESKQGVSQEVYECWAKDQDVRAGDILLVRDGTYLVGTSVLVSEDDLPLLFCGGIYKLRCLEPDTLSPALLFALLNTPFVQRQIRNKQFTRDVIDTLGGRIVELQLTLPRNKVDAEKISAFFATMLEKRTSYRTALHQLTEHLLD